MYKNNEQTSGNNEISSGIKTFNFNTEFTYSPENIYSTRWGFKYSHELYEMTAFGNNMKKQNEAINQYSLYYDNYIRITDKVSTRVECISLPIILLISATITVFSHVSH